MRSRTRAAALIACLLLGLLAGGRAEAHDPLYDSLNTLEQSSVDGALTARGLALDDAPAGKRFGRLIVVNLEVFQDDQPYLTWANVLHATTRPFIVEDEVLWQPGQPFDRALVEETARNLRLSVNFSVVALVPVRSPEPGTVDILAVTRDTWSLRLSTQLSAANGVIDLLYVAATERNLAGAHKEVAVVTIYEQDTVQLGPTYIDPRLFRSRLALTEQLLFAINHGTGALEGTVNTLQFGLPLYSLHSRWGFLLTEDHDFTIDRSFVGSRVRTYDNPDTPQVEAVPFEVDVHNVQVRGSALYGLGVSPRHVFSLGYGLDVTDERLIPETDPVTRAAFRRDVLPLNEVASFLELGYELFEARYAAVRNYQTFALAEDVSLGLDVTATLRVAPQLLGSDNDFLEGSLGVGYTAVVNAGGGHESMRDAALLTASASVGERWDVATGDLVDRTLSGTAHLMSPPLGPLRIHLGGSAQIVLDRATTALQTLGGSSGLRGYPSGAFIGESQAIGHLEVRTLPLELLSLYFGLVAFFDAATVFDQGETPPFLSDVGLGLRLVAPQLQRFAYRFDYAFPTSGPSRFFPGVFTVGVEQVF